MARAQLGVGHLEFLDRLVKAVSITDYMVGLFKAPVFAGIIAIIGCYQGFRTQGGAESVGQHTTRAVVQSIFLVILADGCSRLSSVFWTCDMPEVDKNMESVIQISKLDTLWRAECALRARP